MLGASVKVAVKKKQLKDNEAMEIQLIVMGRP